jgi:hypothetical protein
MKTVTVGIKEHEASSFEIAKTKAEELAGTIQVSDGTWVISQSLAEDIVFVKFTGKMPDNFVQSIAGRVFSEKGELRWLREGGKCRMWLIEEGAGDTRYRRRDERYYLWGMRTVDGMFSENRTGKEFRYPLLKDAGITVDDRAYIEVAEHLAAAPETWPEDVDKLERLLNQPEIVAHRYLRVGCGTGSVEANQ